MNEKDFCKALQAHCESNGSDLNDIFDDLGEPDEASVRLHTIETFDDAGVLTMNQGLVFRLDDGSEFQVTVVQSKGARR